MLRKVLYVLAFLLAAPLALAQGACPAGAPVTGNNCYFIAANGSDSNSGTSESSPLLHAPGMSTCSGTCAGITPSPGQGFIFRGGDTWHFGNSSASPYTGGNFAMGNWAGGTCKWEGQVNACLYWGVDKTWSSGSPWSRPIFNSDNPLSTSPVSSCPYQDGGGNIQATIYNGEYLDNFEWVGFCSSRNPASTGPSTDFVIQYAGTGDVIETNNYIHGWTATTSAGTSNNTIPCTLFGGSTQGTATQSMIGNVVDGSDSVAGACAWATFPNFLHFADNIIRYTTQGVGDECHDIHDNIFEYFTVPIVPTHGNILECNDEAATGVPNVFYNNIMRHVASGFFSSGQVGWWFCPNGSSEDFWFGNKIYDSGALGVGNSWAIAGSGNGQYPGCTNAATQRMFNNSFSGALQPCHLSGSNTSGGQYLYVENEYLANTPYDGSGCNGGAGDSSNVSLTWAQSDAQGYTTGSPGVTDADTFNAAQGAPTSTGGATIGAGHNENAYCATLASFSETDIGTDAANACAHATTDAVSYNTATHTAVYPAVTAVLRPATAAWDSGADQGPSSGGGGGATPEPNASVSPSSLAFGSQSTGTTSSAQTVTLTNSGTAALTVAPPALTTGTEFNIASTTCGSSLPASSSCTVSIGFKPLTAGNFTDTLTFTDNSGGTSGVEQMVSLSGTGVSGVTWTLGSRSPAPQDFTCSGNVAGTTATCSATLTVVAGQAVALPISAWTNSGPAPTFNAVTGDTFVHPSGCYETETVSGKTFMTDAVYVLSPATGTHTYTWTINTTGSIWNIDVDPIAFSVSSGTVGFGSCAKVAYPNCSPTSCTAPTPTIPSSSFVLQWAALANGPSNGPPSAPWTSPLDVDNANVYGTFVGALNQTTTAPIIWSTLSSTYLAASAMVFTQASPCSISSVTNSCTPNSVEVGGSSACAATVNSTGSSCNLSVTWSASHGTISSGGAYTAPGSVPGGGTDTVTATSVQDATKSGASTVAITAAPSTVTGVSVSCSPVTVEAGRASTCFAVVAGTGGFSTAVTWSATYGTINSSGTYVAPSIVPAGGADTITATSAQTPSVSGNVSVTVTAPSGGSTIGAPIEMII